MDHGAKALVERLLAWDETEGLCLAFLLSGHAFVVMMFEKFAVRKETIMNVFSILCECGDVLSRLGAIEYGLDKRADFPQLDPFLISMIEDVKANASETGQSSFSELSDLFILVDAELAARRVLNDAPPFYRRQAALAHAALILRQMRLDELDPRPICDWTKENRAGAFYFRTLVDMRTAPRWHPDLVHEAHLRQEFIGRILDAAKRNNIQRGRGRLSELALESDGLEGYVEALRPFLPGPLDGEIEVPHAMPAELLVGWGTVS